VEASVNTIVAGANTLLVSTVNNDTGGIFAGGGATVNLNDEVDVFLLVPSGNPSSVTVRVTVYIPGKK